jgi:RND family efflux transporter MFP subunit
MKEPNRNYKNAFWAVLALNIAMLFGFGVYWWRLRQNTQPVTTQLKSMGGGDTASPHSDALQGAAPSAAPNQGPALAPVQLTPQRMQAIGVKLGTAEMKMVYDEIRVTGNVDLDERKLAYVQTRFPGWLRKVYADANYQFVRKGQPLFTVYSPDLVTTEQEYLLAKKNVAALQSSSIGGVASGADALLTAARQRLEQWEVPASEIAKLESSGKVITDLTFNSPASGYITERNALPNMYVQPETKLYTVADLSTVWVYAQVFQTDLGKIRPGDAAIVAVDAYPGRKFSGRVDQILPQVDMNTRTVRVRLVFSNPGLKLTPGMYVNVALKIPMGRQLVVPSAAVFQSGTRQIVFVSKGEGSFEPREVEAGTRVGDATIIEKGLKPGESVVTSANFLIDSESQLQAATGAFTPPPPGAGAAAAMNRPASAEQANIELTTEPSPPRKGSNLFRVKLTSREDKPITGAQVTVTFYMPAMPAMGMAAMKTTVTCDDKGNGTYEGKGDLGSGGTWQVTLTAMQNGQMIANKQLTVNATGGM